ncbi:TPA: hypothetical protein ACW0NO_002313 [Enterobacter ludwigii]|jgi:hypothetical protein|uniref:hypothetical protein n=1 Tax=Enterobacter TaxID=547 RepID=UPI0004480BAB|nr:MULTISPECIES: hypothetical protein [Enterobacter]MCL6720315.1 hypothetical protein [Klebsiella sp. T2.Ur]GJK55663.1 hypothetical protein TUM17561_30810 [Enterobacter cloacae]AKM87967.1 hypothetical protein ABT55_15550 [Enterobacter ludwigii]AWC86072.1 hypothetical protein AM410_17215 [Enterobacter cloacae complex sp. FDA-CDC-AR_0164]EKS7106492.1 hypothetical protein [Enterobacter ludwigii]
MVNLENLLLLLTVGLFLVVVIMDLFSSRYFKKHEADYNQLLSDYRRKGYDLDLVTNYASFFGSLANYQKIIWFIRLHKGVKMKFTRDRLVQEEAYKYIQSLPDEKIAWMLKLHRRYKVQALIFTLWLIVGLFFVNFIK